ncbi:hypothetical protein AGMMS50212_11920 [Spirochaetia bacterium]|nr:hypothetical protein AGMMS50212_11920 [Spirochaetia bacterium]
MVNGSSELNRENLVLKNQWKNFFDFERDKELYEKAKCAILDEIDNVKKTENPRFESKEFLKRINIFNPKFRTSFPDSDEGSVLGCLLYALLTEVDTANWHYEKISSAGDKYPRSVYSLVKE